MMSVQANDSKPMGQWNMDRLQRQTKETFLDKLARPIPRLRMSTVVKAEASLDSRSLHPTSSRK
jgi:hypothetical protein